MSDQQIKDQNMKLIMERIRLILARAESPNEGEAKIATEMAHKMLKEYNLTLSDLEVAKEGIVEIGYEQYNRIAPWKLDLLYQIARTNYCEGYQSIKRSYTGYGLRNDSDKTFIIVGREANVATAKAMATYLVDIVERMAKKLDGGNGEKKSYKYGITKTLCQRLYDMIKKERVETTETTALVLREEGKVQKHLQEAHPDMETSKRPDVNVADAMAFMKGIQDGYSIGLNTQIKDSEKNTSTSLDTAR